MSSNERTIARLAGETTTFACGGFLDASFPTRLLPRRNCGPSNEVGSIDGPAAAVAAGGVDLVSSPSSAAMPGDVIAMIAIASPPNMPGGTPGKPHCLRKYLIG